MNSFNKLFVWPQIWKTGEFFRFSIFQVYPNTSRGTDAVCLLQSERSVLCKFAELNSLLELNPVTKNRLTHDEELGDTVFDVAAVSRHTRVPARVVRGHVSDHQGAVGHLLDPDWRRAQTQVRTQNQVKLFFLTNLLLLTSGSCSCPEFCLWPSSECAAQGHRSPDSGGRPCDPGTPSCSPAPS